MPMNLFAAAQQTSTAKLPAFYQRFQTEETTLRVNGAKITIKMFLMEIFLGIKLTMNILKIKRLFFEYFCRIMTRALTFRP